MIHYHDAGSLLKQIMNLRNDGKFQLSPLKRNPSNHSLRGRSGKGGATDLCQTQKIFSCTPSPELGYDDEEEDRVQSRVPTITLRYGKFAVFLTKIRISLFPFLYFFLILKCK